MSGLTFITDDILLTIADNCPHLTAIGLKGCREVMVKCEYHGYIFSSPEPKAQR